MSGVLAEIHNAHRWKDGCLEGLRLPLTSSRLAYILNRQRLSGSVLLATVTYAQALAVEAVAYVEPLTKPWDQVVAYVRDLDGCLFELCTEIG